MIAIIAAYAHGRVIGKDNTIPWNLAADRRHFRLVTEDSTVIMGRHTYEAVLVRLGGPLPRRRNIVVSRTLSELPSGFELVGSLEAALKLSNAGSEDEEVFIIGGAQLYQAVLDQNLVDQIYLTEIDADIPGDTVFPQFDKSDWLEISHKSVKHVGNNPYDFAFITLLKKQFDARAIRLTS